MVSEILQCEESEKQNKKSTYRYVLFTYKDLIWFMVLRFMDMHYYITDYISLLWQDGTEHTATSPKEVIQRHPEGGRVRFPLCHWHK